LWAYFINGVIELKIFNKVLLILFLVNIPLDVLAVDYFEIEAETSVYAGAYFKVTIYARNANTTLDSDYTGTVTFEVSPYAGTVSPTSSGNFISGEWSTSTMQIFAADSSVILTCRDAGGATGTATIEVKPNPATQLLIFMPGQTRTPGISPGATPDVVDLFEGVNYSVTVYAVDGYWNWDQTYSGSMDLINPAGTVVPGNTTTSNGMANFTVYFTATGGVTLSSTTPWAASEYVNVQSATEAWCHLRVPLQITAGVPFSLTATVSTHQADPNQILPSNNDTFRILRFISGTSDSATGNWEPITDFTVNSGQFSRHDFTYDRAESIYLRADKIAGGSVNVYGVNSNIIEVLPNIPANIQVTVSSQQVQAQHQATITVLVLDQYGNATRSSLHDFDVNFALIASGGYLSLTQTVTDDTGYTSTVFTGGNVNETAQVQITVRDSFTASVYLQQSIDINVSVAKAEPGSILNYPNPFNPARNQTTSINYYLEEPSDIEIRIYDAFGRLVLAKKYDRSSTDQQAQDATQSGGAFWEWDGKNGEGRVVANGIYFVKIVARGSSRTQEFKRRVGVLK